MSRLPTITAGGQRPLRPSAWSLWVFVSWVYASVLGLLVAWVGLAMLLAGWRPVVIDSDSMQPNLRPGDVVMTASPGQDTLGAGTIIVFEDEGERVTHRIVDLDPSGYVTRGDANPSPDAQSLARDEVIGVGRLVIPFVGLPLVWLHEGTTSLLALWALVTLLVVGTLLQRPERRDREQVSTGSLPRGVIGMRRVRLLAAVLLLGQYAADPSVFQNAPEPLSPGLLVGGIAAALLSINLLSILGLARAEDDRAYAIAEIAADAGLTIAVLIAAEGASVAWVLLALPVIGAVAQFRVTGALVLWSALATVVVAMELWSMPADAAGIVPALDELRRTVERLGIVLIVMVPGGYLLEQLLAEVVRQRSVTEEADRRSGLLATVLTSTQGLNRLDGSVVDGLVGVAAQLGFDHAAVWLISPGRRPRVVAWAGERSFVSTIGPELAHVDRADAGTMQHAAIEGNSLRAFTACDLADLGEPDRLLLTLAHIKSEIASDEQEAIQLLASHARIAIDNERLVGSLRGMQGELEREALYDTLTGLPNRAHFQRELDERIGVSRVGSVGLMFLDLDGFKAVNDQRGHDAGDELLVVVGQRLAPLAERDVFVSRLGGDEFTVIVPDTSAEQCEELGRQICAKIAEPVVLDGDAVNISASIGVALSGSFDTVELTRRADVAMYAAKASGRGRVRLFSEELEAEDRRLQQLRRDFPVALRGGDLRLEYQPIVEATTHELVGAEALLRWNHRSYGAVPAEQAVGVAEQAGLLDELGDWVIEEAVATGARWVAEGGPLRYLSINVAAPQLEPVDRLISTLQRAMERHHVRPERLVIELSEQIRMDQGLLAESLHALSALGVLLALDDFGQGQTSLAHLRDLPLDWLKLDRAFTKNLELGRVEYEIADSVAAMARRLGMSTVVEGVESDAQIEVMNRLEVDYLQGYAFARSLTPEDFNRYIERAASRDSQNARG